MSGMEPTSSNNENPDCAEPTPSKNDNPQYEIPFLSKEDILKHINDLQKEKETWISLRDEKLKYDRKLLKQNKGKGEDDDENMQDDRTPQEDIKIMENDLNFLSEAPDYQKIAESYMQVQKCVVLAEAQHDKSMECFNNVLQWFLLSPELKKLNIPRSDS